MVLHYSIQLPAHLADQFPRGEGGLQAIELAFPLFILSMIVEHFLVRNRSDLRPAFKYNACDAVASVSAGLVSEMATYLTGNMLKLLPYAWILHNLAFTDIGAHCPTILTVILVDFGYYWGHRSSHFISLFWAGHGVHHSSEHMTLSTSVRQGILESNFTGWAWLWMAFFGIPVKTYLFIYQINQIWTFYTHTGVVKTLHPLVEYFFNTPSHHRVHHARNPHGLDKNFGGFFILWDRMFGTFQAERGDETFGLVHPIMTGDPVPLQTFHLRALWSAFWAAPTWRHSFGLLIWSPACAPSDDGVGWTMHEAPEPENNHLVYDPHPGRGNDRLVRYAIIVGIVTILSYLQVTQLFQSLSFGETIVCWALLTLQLSSVSWMLDGRPTHAVPVEVSRYPLLALQLGAGPQVAAAMIPVALGIVWYVGLLDSTPTPSAKEASGHKD